jgi:type IV pilus assembly protein PilB
VILKKKTEEKLGEILLKQGVISQKQLDQVLELQRNGSGLFGEILIELGYVSEQRIAEAIVSQYGFPFMPVENYTCNQEAVKIIPESVAMKHRLLPLDLIGDILVVAMANPINRSAVEEVEMLTGKKIQCFIGITTAINKAITGAYAKRQQG